MYNIGVQLETGTEHDCSKSNGIKEDIEDVERGEGERGKRTRVVKKEV